MQTSSSHPSQENRCGIVHRPCHSNEKTNMFGSLKNSLFCSVTATMKNHPNTSPSAGVATIAMLGFPSTAWNKHTIEKSSTGLSKTTPAVDFPVHCFSVLEYPAASGTESNAKCWSFPQSFSCVIGQHIQAQLLFFTSPFALVWGSTGQARRQAHMPIP